LNLNADRLAAATIPVATGWLLGACMEARGKQDLWMKQKPELLTALRQQSIIQSVESSNRIEGVTVAPGRLRPVVLEGAGPRDRSEEELAGYRRALDRIFRLKGAPAVSPAVIQRLHALAQGGHSADAGQWKQRDNEIIEILADGRTRIRFRPTSARETPKAIAALCDAYQTLSAADRVPPLLSIATFVFDFLCVHPFRDGNGRVSRLLTTRLLSVNNFEVVRYVSLERLVEERKDEYYRVLESCSGGWHEGRNDIVPWWNFFLSIVRAGYREFESQVESSGSRSAKSELVRNAVYEQVGRFTLADIVLRVPGVSPQLIKKVLAELKQQGTVRLSGKGRGAQWELRK
jgi:Fic family protein